MIGSKTNETELEEAINILIYCKKMIYEHTMDIEEVIRRLKKMNTARQSHISEKDVDTKSA